MIAWEKGHLVVSSVRSWAGISLSDYCAAYKAMVHQRNRASWVKIIDLSDLAGEIRDIQKLQMPETAQTIQALGRWSAQEGMKAQILVVGPKVKPSILEALAYIYALQSIPVEYCHNLRDAFQLAESYKPAKTTT